MRDEMKEGSGVKRGLQWLQDCLREHHKSSQTDSQTHMPTNWKFLGVITVALIFVFSLAYKLGGRDISTTRSISELVVQVSNVADIVRPLPAAISNMQRSIEDLKNDMARLEGSQKDYDEGAVRFEEKLINLEKLLLLAISSGDKRSTDLFYDLQQEVATNTNRVASLRKEFAVNHPNAQP